MSREATIRRIAKFIGIEAAGQELSAEDRLAIEEELDDAMSGLRFRGVIQFIDLEQAPEGTLIPLARALAWPVAQGFGIAGADLDRIEMLAMRGESDLRAMQREDDSRAPIRANYF